MLPSSIERARKKAALASMGLVAGMELLAEAVLLHPAVKARLQWHDHVSGMLADGVPVLPAAITETSQSKSPSSSTGESNPHVAIPTGLRILVKFVVFVERAVGSFRGTDVPSRESSHSSSGASRSAAIAAHRTRALRALRTASLIRLLLLPVRITATMLRTQQNSFVFNFGAFRVGGFLEFPMKLLEHATGYYTEVVGYDITLAGRRGERWTYISHFGRGAWVDGVYGLAQTVGYVRVSDVSSIAVATSGSCGNNNDADATGIPAASEDEPAGAREGQFATPANYLRSVVWEACITGVHAGLMAAITHPLKVLHTAIAADISQGFRKAGVLGLLRHYFTPVSYFRYDRQAGGTRYGTGLGTNQGLIDAIVSTSESVVAKLLTLKFKRLFSSGLGYYVWSAALTASAAVLVREAVRRKVLPWFQQRRERRRFIPAVVFVANTLTTSSCTLLLSQVAETRKRILQVGKRSDDDEKEFTSSTERHDLKRVQQRHLLLKQRDEEQRRRTTAGSLRLGVTFVTTILREVLALDDQVHSDVTMIESPYSLDINQPQLPTSVADETRLVHSVVVSAAVESVPQAVVAALMAPS